MSVRLRLTLWYDVLFAVALLAFGATVYGLELRRVDVDRQLRLQANAQAIISTYGPKDHVLHLEMVPAEQSVTLDKSRYGILVSPDGTIVQRLGTLTDDDADLLWTLGKNLAVSRTRFTDFTRDGIAAGTSSGPAYQAIAMVITGSGQNGGWLILATPRPDSPEMSSLLLTMVVVGTIILVLSAAGGYWLAVRAMRPVHAITQTAAEISESDLSRRLDLNSADELGELASTFDRMLDRLTAAFERERQFTSDASHELRTPLTIVDLEVSRALAAPRSADEYRLTLSTIRAENDAMIRMVSGLLTLARADAQRSPLRLEMLDLGDLTLEVVERLVPFSQRTGVRLETADLPEITIRGDRPLVGQLLTNLVENGIKYTSGIGCHVKVMVGARRDADQNWAWVRVEDEGPGIAAEHTRRIFERFYRVDRARSQRDLAKPAVADPGEGFDAVPRGSGLGLAIARWIARAHGGEIGVTSIVGRGSVFEVRLPLDDG